MTTQSIAADLQAIRVHKDRMEARTNTRLRLAELAAMLPTGSRLLTPSLLTDYGTREATKQAQALTSALLRQLSTWPPESSTSVESIPKHWEEDLAVGGDVETVCRRQITESIVSRWSQPPGQPLPKNAADLARYGQPACDLAKGCAIILAQAAYQLAKSDADITVVSKIIAGISRACQPPKRFDLGELVRKVCTDPAVRQGSLQDAAGQLAAEYLEQSAVKEEAWDSLGGVLVNGYPTLKRLAANALSAAGVQTDSLVAQDNTAASQVKTYLDYLTPENDPGTVAAKLFDLAVTQRAMLPAAADIEQSLDLVQVSADTRSLLAPDWQTAQQKLTGMQFHHFGAFYKRSWRANDWMWGRLDGAGWLVHVLLDPRHVRRTVQAHANERERGATGTESGAQWFLRRLKTLGAPDFPSSGYRVAAAGGGSDQYLTEDILLDELGFLDDPSKAIPPSIPKTSLWLAQAWQQRVLDEELDGLADTVIDPQPGKKPDWSPASSRTWAKQVLAAGAGDAKYALLNENPVARETFATDTGSPLMARTVAKAAATASRRGGLGPTASRCPEATADYLANTDTGRISRGVVDQRHCQVGHHRRRRATRSRRCSRDSIRNTVWSHGPDHGWDWRLSHRPGNLAALEQAAFRTIVTDLCRRGTFPGDARRTQISIRHREGSSRPGRQSRLLARRTVVAPTDRRRSDRPRGHRDRSRQATPKVTARFAGTKREKRATNIITSQ